MSDITEISNDLTTEIDAFLKELPCPLTSMQSWFMKELSLDNKSVTLLAQKCKGSKGMTWNVNISNYSHN